MENGVTVKAFQDFTTVGLCTVRWQIKRNLSLRKEDKEMSVLLLVGKLEVTSFVSEVRSSGGVINSAIV